MGITALTCDPPPPSFYLIEERVFSPQCIVFSTANINVSICFCAVLCCKPGSAPVVSSYVYNIVSQHHYVITLKFDFFLTVFIEMVYGVKTIWWYALVMMPTHNHVGGVHFIAFILSY